MADPNMGTGSHLGHLLGAFPTAWLAGLGLPICLYEAPLPGRVSLCYLAFLHYSPLSLHSPPPQHLSGTGAVEKSAFDEWGLQGSVFHKTWSGNTEGPP